MYTDRTLPEREHVHTRRNTSKSRPSTRSSTHICIYLYIFMYIYINIHENTHIFTCMCTYVHKQHTTGARACAHTREHGHVTALRTWQHTYMYVFIYRCICIYMYIYENTHIFTCMCIYVHRQHSIGARACAHTREHGHVTAPPRGSTHICIF